MHETISATDFRRRLAQNPNLRVIDVRTPAEYQEAHVSAAVNKPLDRLKPREFADSVEELFVVCRTGNRGRIACEQLTAAGVGRLYNVDGGTLACEEVGVEVRRGKPMMPLERQVRIAAGSLVVLGVLLGLLHPAFVALSAFVGAGLVFAGATDTCAMGMLIAKAPWNQTLGQAAPAPGPSACSRPAG